MGRRAKPVRVKAEAKRPLAGKSPTSEASGVNDLGHRLAESLEREKATSEILRVISESQTDVQPVFDTIIQSAVRLLGGFSGVIAQIVGDQLHLAALTSTNPSGDAAQKALWPKSVKEDTSLHGQVIAALAPRFITDVESDRSVPPIEVAVARARGYRSIIGIPLLRDGRAVGSMTVTRRAPGPFADGQVALLQTFANQAVIAIQNVRLFNETKEALEQQTATAEILAVISSSPTEVQPVFDTIAARAKRLCDARECAVFRFDDDLIHLVALADTGAAWANVLRSAFPRPPDRGSMTGRAILTRSIVHIPDVLTDPEYELTEAARASNIRSVLVVPMIREGEVVGAITVDRYEPKAFLDKQIGLVKIFADQAVIAIENVRLFTELQEKNRDLNVSLEQQTTTAEILRVISGSPTDTQPVFDTIAQSAARLCEAFDAAMFLRTGDHLRLVAHHGPIPIQPMLPLVRGTSNGRAVLDGRTVHVADMQTGPEEFPEGSANARLMGHRTILSVPLMGKEGAAIGTINVRRTEARLFTDAQVALLETFADQAVIAIENVRLFKELEEKNRALTLAHAQVTESLEQQTATSEILRVISRSPTDVQPVFDIIVENACRLCDGVFANAVRFDGALMHNMAHHGFSPEARETMLRAFPMGPTRESMSGRAILNCAVVQSEDTSTDDGATVSRQLARLMGFRAQVSVPMLRDGVPVGAITVARRERGLFPERQVDLLQTLADQAVIAIENVRLFTELEARTQELTRSVGELRALGEIGQAISSTLDLQTVLSTIVARATQLAGVDAGVIYEYDEQREVFEPRATERLEAGIVQMLVATPVRKGQGATGRLAEVSEPIQLADLRDLAEQIPVRDVLLRAGYRALLAVPLVREDHLIGGLTVFRKAPGEFAPDVVDLLKTFATQSALAIQNARLFLEIEDKSRQLEAASQHKSEFLANMSHELRTPLNAIIGFSEVLTERMFGELNEKQDEYLKDIYASGQHLLSLINDILDLSKIEAGRMELEPADFDLPSAIDNALTLVRERAGRRGITLGRAIDERVGAIRADERKVKQVLLNLLSNALKFTPEGGRIDVRATVNDELVEISVIDTGVGIAPEDQEAVFEEFRQVGTADKKVEGTGLGLALSRKFIELHGGRIWVKSQVGTGATFTFTIPVRREPSDRGGAAPTPLH